MARLLSLIFFFISSAIVAASDYHEQLNLRPLPLSGLLASFNFRSNTSVDDFDAQNFRLFPRSLAQILQHAGTRELHLRFTLGRWDTETWGARPWDGTKEGGQGVELWAWLDATNDEEADAKWLTLTNALSGLFCASLNFIDETKTIRPVLSFQPEGHHSSETLANTRLLHGVLPHEVVCTENLTPFLKLLPCKGKAGIASLLDGHKLFDASFQSMAIDVKPVCEADGKCVLQMEQTIDMVLDVERSKRPHGKRGIAVTHANTDIHQITRSRDHRPATTWSATPPNHITPTKPATRLTTSLVRTGPCLKSLAEPCVDPAHLRTQVLYRCASISRIHEAFSPPQARTRSKIPATSQNGAIMSQKKANSHSYSHHRRQRGLRSMSRRLLSSLLREVSRVMAKNMVACRQS